MLALFVPQLWRNPLSRWSGPRQSLFERSSQPASTAIALTTITERSGRQVLFQRLARIRFRLELDVVLDADLVDQVELGLDIVDVLFLVVEDLVEDVA